MIVLIEGVLYRLIDPDDEAALEKAIQSNCEHIFGPDSFYFGKKRLIRSKAGVASMPDGYIIFFDPKPKEGAMLPSTLPLKPEDGTKTSSAGTSKALSVILSGALSLSSVVSTQAQEPTHKLPGLAVVTQPVDKKALSEKVERLIKQIESPDAEKRIIAAQALGKIGPAAEAAVPALINALADEDKNVRYLAALALGLIGPAAKAAIPTLQRSLKDENPGVREAAKTAIEKIQKDIKKHVKKRFF